MRVPTYENQAGLIKQGPNDLVDTGSYAVEGRAVAKQWEQVGQAGEVLGKVAAAWGQSLREARQVDEAATASVALKTRLYELRDQVQGGNNGQGVSFSPDPAAWGQNFQEEGGRFLEDLLGQYSDPRVQAHIRRNFAEQFPVMLHGLNVEAKKRQIADFAGNVEANYANSINLYGQAANDLERARIKADTFGMLAGGVAAGYLLPAKAQQFRDKFDTAVRLNGINQEILANPAAAYDRLGNPAQNFPGLDAESAMALRGRALGELRRVQGDTALKVEQDYQAGKLTPENLKGLFDARQISVPTFRFYDAALQQPGGGRADTNPELFVRLWDQARQGQMNPEAVYQGLKAGRLKLPDAKFLMGQQDSSAAQTAPAKGNAFVRDPNFRLGLQEIEARLKPLDFSLQEKTKRAAGIGGPRGALPSHEAAYLFLQACQQAEKDGTLNAKFMWDKAQEIIKPFEIMGTRQAVKQPGALKRAWNWATGGDTPSPQPSPPGGRGGTAATPAAPGSRGPLFNPTQGPAARQQQNW